MKTGKSFIVGDFYEGKRFNAPNDITVDEKGRIYFSDPRYLGHEPVDQAIMAVYRIDPDGSIERIITDAGKPNGVAISPDQKTLYVVSNANGSTGLDRLPKDAPTHKGRMSLMAYDLSADGKAKFRETLIDYYPEDGPDGLLRRGAREQREEDAREEARVAASARRQRSTAAEHSSRAEQACNGPPGQA